MKMHKGVLEKVRMVERKNNIIYADEYGSFYRISKILFIVSFIYVILMKLFYFASYILFPEQELAFSTPAIGTVLIIAGFVLVLIKNSVTNIAGTLMTAASSVMLMVHFSQFFSEGRINSATGEVVNGLNFYWKHVIPLAAMTLFALFMTAILVRAHYKTRKQYNRILKNVYDTYKKTVGKDDISEEEWQEFIESYDPYNYKPQFKANREDGSE